MADISAFPSESRAGVPRSQKHGCEEPLKATQGYGELLLLAALQPPRGSPCPTLPHTRAGGSLGALPHRRGWQSGVGPEQEQGKTPGLDTPAHRAHVCT